MTGTELGWGVGSIATLLPLCAAAGDFVAAAFLLLRCTPHPAARSLAAFAALLGTWHVALALRALPADSGLLTRAADLLAYSLILLPAAGLQAAARISAQSGPEVRAAVFGGWGVGLVFVVLQSLGLVFRDAVEYPGGRIAAAGPALPAFILFVIGAAFAGVVLNAYRLRGDGERQVQLHSRYWVAGTALLAPVGCLNFLVSYGIPIVPPSSTGNLLLLTLCGVAAIRHGLVSIDTPVLRAAGAAATLALIATPVAAGVGRAATGRPDPLSWVLIALGTLSGAITLQRSERARRVVGHGVDVLLFPKRAQFRTNVVALLERHSSIESREAVAALLQGLVELLGATGAAIYAHDCDQPIAAAGAAPARDAGASTPPELRFDLRHGRLVIGTLQANGSLDEEGATYLRLLAVRIDCALELLATTGEVRRQGQELRDLRTRIDAETSDVTPPTRPCVEVDGIIGGSRALAKLLDVVAHAAPTDMSILITGETGTGKELIAQAVHRLSKRSTAPLVSVNCPAIPVELAESELFGHERGSFTGAHEARAGKFEAAQGGTLFLDEVADLPMTVQTKLLRVLQEREVQRLGSHLVHKLDIRVVAATNRNLRDEAARGRFREDLLYRLAGVELRVPALRERMDDVPMLANHFAQQSAATGGRAPLRISADAMAALRGHSWPGNVRELRHVIERAVLLSDGPMITVAHLGGFAEPCSGTNLEPGGDSLRTLLQGTKLRRVETAIVQAGGNQAAAARILGMSRSNLSRLLKRYAIDVDEVMRRAFAQDSVAP